MATIPTAPPLESIRALRTHVMARHINEGHRALAICAPSIGVGCTYVAVNLAVALSQIGVNTLLVDGDLRNPSVGKMMGLADSRHGLQQCLGLAGEPYNAYVETDVMPHLSVLLAGGSAPDAQELLAGSRFSQTMDACMRDYDATIVDTPPANICSDASRITNVVTYGLIVARRNRTYVHDIKLLAEQLKSDHARIIGTVLNDA